MLFYILCMCMLCVCVDIVGGGGSTGEVLENEVSADSRQEALVADCKVKALNELLARTIGDSFETGEEEYIREKFNSTIDVSGRRYQAVSNAEESSEANRTAFTNFSYTVSIKRKAAHYATGALIDKNWVLTVAREFYNARESMKLFQVVLGTVDCKRGGVTIAIKEIDVHPRYVPGQPSFDISLVRLAWSAVFNEFIAPIPLSNETAGVISAKFQTTYWPRVIVNRSVVPLSARERVRHSSLRVSRQRLVPREECARRLAAAGQVLHRSSLCLHPVTMYHSPCMPDPGAPVAGEGALWGITSGWTSAECRHEPSPTVFTRVATPTVSTWIQMHDIVFQ